MLAGIFIKLTISLYPYYYLFTVRLHNLQKFHPIVWGLVAEISLYKGFWLL
jgi:hypothetical protein